jgi:phosphoglucomutase
MGRKPCQRAPASSGKDGLIVDWLAAEITAKTGKDPGEHYRELTEQFGTPLYTRVDAPACPEQKAKLRELTPEAVDASTLAGEPIVAKLTRAPGDNAPIGGLKAVIANGMVCGAAFGHRKYILRSMRKAAGMRRI